MLLALIARLLLLDHGPALFPDSGTYMQAANDLLADGPWRGQARRTPGYPLVVLLAGGSPWAVVALQALTGVLTSALLFWMALELTGSLAWGAVAGAAHALNLQQIYAEAGVMTEAISAFATVATLSLCLHVVTNQRAHRNKVMPLLLLSLIAGWAILVRPQFVFFLLLLPAVAVWCLRHRRPRATRTLAAAALVTAPALALVVGWSAVVHKKTGYFTLSTQSGFGMVNHPIDYIELAPPQYAQVRDVLIKTREQRIAEVGHSRNTIWYAWPEIQRVTGWSLPEASRQFQAMCRQMFVEHPWLYARSVASAWVDFWTVPFFWEPEQVHPPALRSAIEGAWWVQHKLLRLANLAFVLVVAAAAVWPAFRRRVRWDIALSAIAATILMSSLIQALADQGASSRYHLPTQSLVVLVLVVVAARWWRAPPGADGATRSSAGAEPSGAMTRYL